MNTSIPGKIDSYDGEFAIVHPTMPMQLSDGSILESPKIVNVPVLWFIGDAGSAQISVPLKKDDDCYLIFSQRAIEDWLNGSDQSPSDPRQFDLSDCFCIPVLRPGVAKADIQNVNIKYGDGTIKIAPDGSLTIDVTATTHNSPTIDINAKTSIDTKSPTININANSALNITSPQTTINGNLSVTGAVAFTGPSVTHGGTQVGKQHKHGGVKSGTSKTGKPV